MRHPDRKLRWTIVAAAGLHLAAMASLRDAAATGHVVRPPPAAVEGPADLELTIVEPPAAVARRAREPAHDVKPPAHGEPRRPPVRSPVPARRPVLPDVSSEVPAAPTPSGSGPERDPAIDPGVADAPGDAGPAPPVPPGGAIPGESGFGLSLADRVALAPDAPHSAPAPTTAPRRAPLTTESVERGLRSALRAQDETLGIGAPERQIVARAVREPLRRVPAPSGTHVAYEIAIDRTGLVSTVRRLRASAGDETMWRQADQAILGALQGQRLPIGVDAQRSGVRIVVDAAILHVLRSGSVDGEWVGACSPTYEDGNLHGSRALFPSETFFAVGGSMFGDRPTGTCTASEDPNGKRHIEVRATTTSHFDSEPPPPGKPKPARLLPWIKRDKKKP